LGFKIGYALAGEAEIGPGSFESFLEFSVFLGELVDSVLEGGVLDDQGLNGFAEDHLVEAPRVSRTASGCRFHAAIRNF
jgi:hypothetical protein